MEKDAPFAQPNNGPAIFAALRDVLAALYTEESTARVVVADAGLDAKQIPFSSRAQTNWHNILAEAIRQARLDPLLNIALANYAANPTLLAAYGQYRLLIDQGGSLEAPAPLPANADLTIAGDVKLNEGDFVGRDKRIAGDDVSGDKVEGDKIDAHDSQGFLNRPTAPVTQHFGTAIHLGPLKISKPVVGILFTSLAAVVLFIGAIALYTHGTFQAITAPTPTPTPTIPTATPTRTPLPTATPLAFATQAVSQTLIVIATFHSTAATDSEAHTKIRRAIADAATSNNEQQLRVGVEPTELTADQRMEAEALGKRYNASMVIWGEDTGVEIIVNFLTLKEPNLPEAISTVTDQERTQLVNLRDYAHFELKEPDFAVAVTITERERTQLANPSAYSHFITQDLPQMMSFFAFFAIGHSYYLNAQYTLAKERIEAAVALEPPSIKPAALAEAYMHLGWFYQALIPTDLPQAVTNYNQAIHLKPSYAIAYNNRGIAYADMGKLAEAIADYDQAIHLNPDDAATYINRGIAYADMGKLAEAIANYDQAIQINPDYARAYINRGMAYTNLGNFEKAIANYDQAIQLNPDYAGAYINRGVVRYYLGNLDEAITNYDQAIQLDSDNVAAYTNRGIARYEQGKLEEAVADFDQAIELNPNDAAAYTNRGIARYEQGKLEEAVADFDQAIELNPNDAAAYKHRGIVYLVQEKLNSAIMDFNQALILFHKAGHRYSEGIMLTYLGVSYVNIGEMQTAIDYYQQALAISRGINESLSEESTLINLGLAYIDLGQIQIGIDYYQQALTIAKEFGDPISEGKILSKLGSAYASLGQVKEARQSWQLSLRIFEEIKSPEEDKVRELLASLPDK